MSRLILTLFVVIVTLAAVPKPARKRQHRSRVLVILTARISPPSGGAGYMSVTSALCGIGAQGARDSRIDTYSAAPSRSMHDRARMG